MAEITKTVYQITYQCDSCSGASVEAVYMASVQNLYEHKCPNCKAIINLPMLYPYMVYK